MIHNLHVIDTRHRPADDRAIRQWLTRLACAVSNPPNEDDLKARLSMVLFVCADFPAGCWTDETLRAAVRKFKFWPAVAEIHDLLKPMAEMLAETLRLTQLPRAREAVQLYAPIANPQEETLRSRVTRWGADDEPGWSKAQPPVRTPEEQLAILRGDRLALPKPVKVVPEEPTRLAQVVSVIADRVRQHDPAD